jgi:transcriptional regulator with XRE-family HTH domain
VKDGYPEPSPTLSPIQNQRVTFTGTPEVDMGELGSLLTRAREARGLTIEDAERDTRISRRYLQALEAEHFEVIPAPVYARGFLRSYSQYLGLDPRETLALFPRDEEPSPYYAGTEAAARQPGQQRQQQQPAAVGAARPSWRRPSQAQQAQQQQQQQQQQPRQPAPRPRPRPEDANWEPTIGVDIGVPAPARRLKTDPAAQARSMTILIVAVGAIAAVILLALAISRLGGDGGGALSGLNTATSTTTVTTDETTTPLGSEVTPGVMPEVVGLAEEAARAAIIAAGFEDAAISVTRQSHPSEKGQVFDQHPAPGAAIEAGDQAIIAVSEGP